MGTANSKKPQITIKSIRANTEDIRSSLRRKQIPLQNKNNVYQTLIDNSKHLDTLRRKNSKKKQLEIDQIQKLVSDVSEELLEYNDENLDKHADESHSFVRVDPDKIKKQKKNTKITGPKNSTAIKLMEIEEKLTRIKNDVNVGIKNEDNKLLILQKKKIEMLSTDLELLNLKETSQFYVTKEGLEKELYKYYQRIIRREKSQARLSKLVDVNDEERNIIKKNSSRLNAIEIMIQDIHDILQNRGDERSNLELLTEELTRIQQQLNEIEDNSKENLKSKTILAKKIEQTKKHIDKLDKKKEMNCLDEMMEQIDKKKSEANNGNSGLLLSNLIEMKSKLKIFTVKHEENDTFRREYLEELDKFLDKIDPNHDGVILRPKKKMSKSVEDLLHLQKEWRSLEKNITGTKVEEMKKVDELLEKFEESIKAKRRSLASLLKKQVENRRKSDEPIRTSVKIFDLPKLQNAQLGETTEKMIKKEKSALKYGTIEYALEEITRIADRIEEIGKDILKFKGTSEDLEYNFYKASLLDKREVLENLSHRSSWNQVDVFKVEILEKIDYFEEYLKYKLDQNVLEKELNEKIDALDAKIRRFTGSFQNIQFNNIEGDLASYLKETERLDSNENREKLKHKLNFLKNILKEKSYVDIPLKHEENLTDTKKIIAESMEYVDKLKDKIEKSTNFDLHESSIIEECLFSKSLELINLNLRNDTPMFCNVKKMLEDIEKCRHLIKSKTKKETFEEIDKKLTIVENEITNFDGLATDQIFLDLINNLDDLEIRLSRIEENQNDQGKNLEYSLRINLLKTKLHQIALDSEKIKEIEQRISNILEMVSNDMDEQHFDGIDKEMVNLKIQLENLDVSEKLSYRKITCLNYIEYLSKKLSDKFNKTRQISRSIIV